MSRSSIISSIVQGHDVLVGVVRKDSRELRGMSRIWKWSKPASGPRTRSGGQMTACTKSTTLAVDIVCMTSETGCMFCRTFCIGKIERIIRHIWKRVGFVSSRRCPISRRQSVTNLAVSELVRFCEMGKRFSGILTRSFLRKGMCY